MPIQNDFPEYNINSFEDLDKILNENNVDAILANLCLSVRFFLHVKKRYPDLRFNGFHWIDDGKVDILPPYLIVDEIKSE